MLAMHFCVRGYSFRRQRDVKGVAAIAFLQLKYSFENSLR